MKVTDVPAQIVWLPDVMAILTEAVRFEFTVIVMLLLTGLFEARQPALLVSTTVTASLLAKVVEVNVGALVPAFTPFIFH